MPSQVEIRACQRSDVPALLEILGQSPEAANWSAAALQSALGENASHFLVTVKDGEVLGFIMGRILADEAEILNLAVVPTHRRKGLAKVLVQSLLHSFAEGGAAMVFLEVRESNRAAIAFYEKTGFARTGTRPGYYSSPPEAALVLSAQLGRGARNDNPQSK